jgi:hypothetical protein
MDFLTRQQFQDYLLVPREGQTQPETKYIVELVEIEIQRQVGDLSFENF